MKGITMPDFSEEMMLEVSENITPRFSKVRFRLRTQRAVG